MSHVVQTQNPDCSHSAGAPSRDDPHDLPLTVIEPESGWQALRLSELWRHRELLYFLAWRDVKVRYKQTLLGVAWAMLQPALMMVVFTLVLDRLAHVPSGEVPYPLFVYAGLVAWSFFATAVGNAAQSVVSAERLVSKVYFPRLAIPLGAIGAATVDFVLACLVLLLLMIYYQQPVRWTLLLAPVVMLLLLVAAIACGAALAALNVAYRDVRYALPFLLQLWLFATPSIYLDTNSLAGASSARSAASDMANGQGGERIPSGESPRSTQVAQRANWLAINPLDGLIACFRATVLGLPLPWRRLVYPAVVLPIALLFGCLYFRRVEDTFADII